MKANLIEGSENKTSKGKKIIAIGLIIGAIGAACIGCTTQASTANLAESNADATVKTVKNTATITAKDLKFPSVIGNDFFIDSNNTFAHAPRYQIFCVFSIGLQKNPITESFSAKKVL